jgi:paraquat-inducible protein B
MGKQASKTAIGAFVVGAIALAVAGVVVFGSGKLFRERVKYVMFFEGSIKGLQVGSPVLVSGGKVGEVVGIRSIFDSEKLNFYNPVFIEIDPDSFQLISAPGRTGIGSFLKRQKHLLYEPLLEKGLKAQLALQSFLTGQLVVSLAFHPDKPVRLVGLIKEVPEIPTVPSQQEELEKTVKQLPQIAGKLDNVLGGIDRLVANLDAKVEPIASDVKKTMETVRQTLGEADKTMASARGALAQAEKTLAFEEGIPGEVASSLLETLATARGSLEESRRALLEAQGLAKQSAYLGYQIGKTLEEVQDMSRSVRTLTDYLEEHPDSLIWGKSPAEGETR